MTDEIVIAGQALFVGGAAVGIETDRRDGARVDDPPDAGVARGIEDVLRALDIRRVDLARLARPKAVIGGAVIERVDAANRTAERARIEQVARGDVDWKAGDVGARARRPDEAAHALAAREQRPDDVGADKSR